MILYFSVSENNIYQQLRTTCPLIKSGLQKWALHNLGCILATTNAINSKVMKKQTIMVISLSIF